MPPLAYLITWTTYGTWLHGDQRGSADPDHNRHGTPYLSEQSGRARFEASELKHKPVTLNSESRRIVTDTITDHIDHRGWILHALNVRTNHVHVVVSGNAEPEKMMREFKAWATRRLREAGLVGEETRVWTRHGSTRYLFTSESVEGAVRYVRDGQGAPLD